VNPLRLHVDGVALWAPLLPDWEIAAAALRGGAPTPVEPARPMGAGLAANERRRAPEGVKIALDVAHAAVACSGHDAATLASVFASAHADLAIVDALCETLARDPLLLSPTRFHHSVHNAASGYWAIANGCCAPSSAVAADRHSFAAGWIEAATQLAAESRPVLLVGFDTEACGLLGSVNSSRGLLGVALVLAPQASARTRWTLDWQLHHAPGEPTLPATAPAITPLRSAAALALADNAMADALPLMELLANDDRGTVQLPLSGGGALMLTRC
jgi:hypothetical protein